MITIGAIADTHIPDRKRVLDERVVPFFRRSGVQSILHAGDVSVPAVIDQLSEVAPVCAVKGNRDWIALRHLPRDVYLNIDEVRIGLTHGHGHLLSYVSDRIKYIISGYKLEMFSPRLLATFPEAKVIVFGHTHRPLNRWVDGKLLFNPGSPHVPDKKLYTPSVGLLRIFNGGEVKGEIIDLGNLIEYEH